MYLFDLIRGWIWWEPFLFDYFLRIYKLLDTELLFWNYLSIIEFCMLNLVDWSLITNFNSIIRFVITCFWFVNTYPCLFFIEHVGTDIYLLIMANDNGRFFFLIWKSFFMIVSRPLRVVTEMMWIFKLIHRQYNYIER